MSTRALLWLGLAYSCFGCAREARFIEAPPAQFQGWGTPADYAWPPRVNAVEPAPQGLAASSAPPAGLPRKNTHASRERTAPRSNTALPGGARCLELLRARGVAFRKAESSRGVDTPIVVQGPIGGVEFWSLAGPMLLDCRLALGLSRVAREFSALGIVRVRFSGAYVYRTSRSGRLSLHAYGLALDVHEVSTRARTYSVKRDFARGLGDGCASTAPLLNRLYCRLRAPGLFEELLTPDYNADHHDHLHLGIAPIGGKKSVARAENARRRAVP